MERKYGSLSSSENPENLAATVKALILGFSSLIILIGGMAGITIAQSDIVEVATQAGLAVSAIWFFYGLVRKIVVRFSRQN